MEPDYIANPPAVNPLIGEQPLTTGNLDSPTVNLSPLKAQAAMLSMLEDSYQNSLKRYNEMGRDVVDPTRDIMASLQESATKQINEMRGNIPDLMADPTIPIDEKTRVVESFRDGNVRAPDTAVSLAQKMTTKPGGKDLNKANNGVYDVAGFWKERGDEWSVRQGIVNSVSAMNDGTMDRVADMVGLFAPLADSYMMTHLQASPEAKRLGMSGKAYATMLPGSWLQEFARKVDALPFDEQTQVLTAIATEVRKGSSMMTSDNSLRALSAFSDISSGDLSTFDKVLMNGGAVLDLLGLPALVRGTYGTAVNAPGVIKKALETRNAAEAGKLARQMERAGKDIPFESGAKPPIPHEPTTTTGVTPDDLAQVTSTPQRGMNDAKIAQLEEKKASMLGEPTEPLASGRVTKIKAEIEELQNKLRGMQTMPADGKKGGTSLALKKVHTDIADDLTSRINRLEDTLVTNRIAEQNLQVITDIEKEITSLKKGNDMVDIPRTPIFDAFRQAYTQGLMYTHNPRSVMNVVSNTNVSEARTLHMAMLVDETDETATALAGTIRNEAIIANIAPQVSVTGRVRWTPPDIEKGIREMVLGKDASSVIDNVDGGLRYTTEEIARGRANIVRDYEEAVGLKLHPSMTSIQTTEDGNKMFIQGVYTKGDTGWDTAQEAVDQALFALRRRNVDKDDITVLERQGDDFVPVHLSDVEGKQGEYLVGLRTQEIVGDHDIGPLGDMDVKLNYFDKYQKSGSNDYGSFQTHILPSANMLDEILTGSATVAVDRTSVLAEALLTKLDEFTTPYSKLNKERRAKVEDYLVEANAKEIPYQTADLYARGFTQDEVLMLRKFRDFQDIAYDLENLDVVRSLRSDGYEFFEGTTLQVAVKKQTKRIDHSVEHAYDDATDTWRKLSDQDRRDIYDNNGYIAELRQPVLIDNNMVTHTIIRQNPSEYSRAFRDSDKILVKKDGYYQTIHKGAKYVEATYMRNGVEVTEVLGVAGNTKEAKAMQAQFKASNPTWDVTYRGDEKAIKRNSSEYWRVNSQSGRIAQRHRSKLIEKTVNNGAALHIENPIESSIRAIQSISGRTAMRPVLDTMKKRFMDQYGHLIATDAMVQRHFPKSRDEILTKGDVHKKELADARTTWNYIQSLENGYANSLDNGIRGIIRSLADVLGEHDLVKAEGFIRKGEDLNPTGSVKSAVFTAYMATAPFRQWMMQGNQAIRAFGYNPQGFLSGSIFEYYLSPTKRAVGAKLTGKQQDFEDFMKSTGLYQSISKNNLIRGSMMDASERRGTLGKLIDGPLGTMRKIGFDAGEHFNLWAHSAAVYDDFVRKGKNVHDARVRGEMASQIRAITYDMNFAGDMPYNQNALALAMTYMQVPHKAIAAMGNRRIPVGKRLQMALFDYAMWGFPQPLVKAYYGDEYDRLSPEARILADDGFEAWFLNSMISMAAGERVAIDFSPTNPMDIEGWKKMFKSVMEGGFTEVLTQSATGKLLADGNGRVWMAMKMTMSAFQDFREGEGANGDPTTILDVVNAWASVSSGWNAAQKARAQWMLGYARDARGGVTDDYVAKAEAIGAAFGFGTVDTRDYYKVIIDENKKSPKQQMDQGARDADEYVRLVNMKHPTADQKQLAMMYMQGMYTHRKMLNPTAANNYWKGATERLFSPASQKMWEAHMKNMNLLDDGDFREKVRISPGIPQEQKDVIIKAREKTYQSYDAMGYKE